MKESPAGFVAQPAEAASPAYDDAQAADVTQLLAKERLQHPRPSCDDGNIHLRKDGSSFAHPSRLQPLSDRSEADGFHLCPSYSARQCHYADSFWEKLPENTISAIEGPNKPGRKIQSAKLGSNDHTR